MKLQDSADEVILTCERIKGVFEICKEKDVNKTYIKNLLNQLETQTRTLNKLLNRYLELQK